MKGEAWAGKGSRSSDDMYHRIYCPACCRTLDLRHDGFGNVRGHCHHCDPDGESDDALVLEFEDLGELTQIECERIEAAIRATIERVAQRFQQRIDHMRGF